MASTLRNIVLFALLVGFSCDSLFAQEEFGQRPLPAESRMAQPSATTRLQLVSPLETTSGIHGGGWQMDRTTVSLAPETIEPRVGRRAVTLSGRALRQSKGDFGIAEAIPAKVTDLGCWVYQAQDANVARIGLQLVDQEGETLVALVDAKASQWQWMEFSLDNTAFEQAYPQADKNKTIDQPLRAVRFVWWTKQAGPTQVTIDGLMARVESGHVENESVSFQVIADESLTPGETIQPSFLFTNPAAQPANVAVRVSLQRDGRLFDKSVPHPTLGTDHARGARSWTMADGERIAEDTLTDDKDYTAAETSYRGGYWSEAEQFVELDQVRTISSMGWLSGDANWVERVDVFASEDGKQFQPVAKLQNANLKGQWGEQRFPEFAPFRARVLRLRYHNQGEKTNVIRMPSAIRIWDGIHDETLKLPEVGEEIGERTLQVTVPPQAFSLVPVELKAQVGPGQYAIAVEAKSASETLLGVHHVFVSPEPLAKAGADSRFGLNAARRELAEENRRLGVGWVRFENLKWPMVSPEAHKYAYGGSVKPWYLDVDGIVKNYRENDLYVLPMMFLTPDWALPEGLQVPDKMREAQPPKNPADYGEFVFQTVARYGQQQVERERLLTDDKKTGLDLIRYYELGNEPNLNPLVDPKRPPSWGPWAGTMPQWWTMWRYGAEAVSQADPLAKVVGPGFAGATAATVDEMRRFQYPDGKSPLDFTDVLSVHFYSGRTPPEEAIRDANNARGLDVPFDEQLRRLVEWRDQYAQGKPIWMTETGYDTGGPIGTSERTQAARLPRVVAMCLAAGIEKVFVYRESGSTPGQHASSGVLRNDYSRRPSWYTYATLIRQLQDCQPGVRLPTDDKRTWLHTWHNGDETLVMAWRSQGEAPLGIELGACQITDAFGNTSELSVTSQLVLTEFPVYLRVAQLPANVQSLVAVAKNREAERLAERKRDASRRVYLFNFGPDREDATVDVGGLRYFLAVPAAQIYSQDNEAGFVDKPAQRDDYKHWLASAELRSAVDLAAGQAFRATVQPGRYRLRLAAQANNGAGLSLSGTDAPTQELRIAPGPNTTAEAVVTVSDDVITLQAKDRVLLQSLVLEEVLEGED